MAEERSAPVWVWLPGEAEPVLAGRFQYIPGRGRFAYDAAYKQAGHPPLAPDMPLKPASLPMADGSGIFPIFQDAGPDSWGQQLLARRLERDAVDPFEALTLCPVDGVGNLALGELTPERQRILTLEEFLAILEEIKSQGRAVTDIQTQVLDAVENGTSLGGARPKLTITRNGSQYLAKFPAKADDPWLPHIECAMLKLARRCGIDTCEGQLWALPDGSNTALLVKRFDRTPVAGGIGRIGFVSAHAVLRLDRQPANATQADAELLGFGTQGFSPASLNKSYVQFADSMMRWCPDQAGQREARRELWRRIVFNAMINNRDDHARNHGLICTDMHARRWRLAPAYDLTAPLIGQSPPSLALAYLYIRASRKQPARLVWAATQADLIEAAQRHYAYDEAEARTELAKMADLIQSEWRAALAAEGMPEAVIERYRGAFALLG